MKRLLPLVALIAFVSGFWTACTIGFDPSDGTMQFSCTSNEDCIAPNVCRGGICAREGGGGTCKDDDEDGYGVGDTSDCDQCVDFGNCEEDCNDGDPSVAPNLSETCDGRDNNCNDEIDEPAPCESNIDCADEQPYIPSCDTAAGTCVYKVPIQTGECAGAGATVACVGGMREDKPDSCF